MPQDHTMIEMVVDPFLDDTLDVRKIEDHSQSIKGGRLESDQDFGVVAVQILALSVVIKESVSVAEIDFTGDLKHVDPFSFEACTFNGRRADNENPICRGNALTNRSFNRQTFTTLVQLVAGDVPTYSVGSSNPTS